MSNNSEIQETFEAMQDEEVKVATPGSEEAAVTTTLPEFLRE